MPANYSVYSYLMACELCVQCGVVDWLLGGTALGLTEKERFGI